MSKNELWNHLLAKLQLKLSLLPDKPEETPESTLKALWFSAIGNPLSSEAASQKEIIDLPLAMEPVLKNLVEQRIAGIPLAHLTKRQQFMGVELLAGPEALVPRKETELLGWAALELLSTSKASNGNPLTLVDVCTGAGNLAVALTVLFPDLITFAADLSEEAVALAKKNVDFHRLNDKIDVRCGDLLVPFDSEEFYGNVDLLLCNPPYISSAKVQTMPEEISGYEPRLAFDGGPFGIKILNRLIKEAPKFLKSGGWLAFEVGMGQGGAVRKRLELNPGYGEIQTVEDAEGNIRSLLARKN